MSRNLSSYTLIIIIIKLYFYFILFFKKQLCKYLNFFYKKDGRVESFEQYFKNTYAYICARIDYV